MTPDTVRHANRGVGSRLPRKPGWFMTVMTKHCSSRRGALLVTLLIAAALNAGCGEKVVYLDVVIFNYWQRPVIDVFINGHWGGLAEAATSEHAGGSGVIAGVPIAIGKQTVKWTLSGGQGAPRLGEVVTATADLSSVPSDHRVLAVIIFPNETVKLKTFRHAPIENQIKQ
jgi:hypothetical protein